MSLIREDLTLSRAPLMYIHGSERSTIVLCFWHHAVQIRSAIHPPVRCQRIQIDRRIVELKCSVCETDKKRLKQMQSASPNLVAQL